MPFPKTWLVSDDNKPYEKYEVARDSDEYNAVLSRMSPEDRETFENIVFKVGRSVLHDLERQRVS